LIVVFVLLPDALFRYDRLLHEERYPPGFYQWLWRMIRGRGAGRS